MPCKYAMVDFGTAKRTKTEGSNEYLYSLAKPLPEIYKSTSELSMDLIQPVLIKINNSLKQLDKCKTHRGYELFKTRLEDLRKAFNAFSNIKEFLFTN